MSSAPIPEQPETPLWKRSLAGLMTAWCLLSPTGLVWAGPVADATAIAGQRPTIGSTAAGTTLINITAPNAAGLSYNRYQRFDVDSTGAILNNSLVSGSNSMGIQIGANSNFAGKSATAIINEVVTALPSQLSGPLAIFGDKARIIVVNPNGITCDGCSFINTSGVALTTGQLQFLNAPGGTATAFDNATALSFVVNGGQIRVTGNGLASPLARLDLIAQTLKLEGPTNVGSGSLNLIAGRNTVDAETLAILAQGSGNDAATQGGTLAIDASLLGAMTAGKILIVSTASGLGVRSATNLAASSGDLRISANGDLTLARADASGNINLSTVGTLSHTGISAQGNADLSAAALNNANQTIVAQGNVRVVAPALNNLGGQILAGGALNISAPGGDLNLSDGTLYGTNGLTVAARNISNSGNFSHSPSVTLVADNTISNTGSFLVGGDLNITASTLNNAGTLGSFGAFTAALGNLLNQGTLQSDGVLDISAVNLDNQSGAQLIGGGNSRILLSGALTNAGTIASTGALEIAADSLNHTGRTETQGDLQLTIGGSASNSGQMLAGAKFDGSFGSLINSGTLQAETDASFNLGAASDNTGGQLLAIQDLSLTTTHSGDLGGTIGANRDVTLNFGSYTHNGGTTFLAGRDLTVNATNFTNNAVMEAWQNLNFNVTGTLANTGQMLAGQDITLKTGTLINTSGFVEATRDLNIEADTVINKRPPVTTVYTNWGETEPAGSVNCRSDHGYCESWKQVEAGPAAVLWAGRNLNAKVSGTLTNDASLIAAVGDVSITADTLANTSHTLTTTWHGHWKEWKGSLWGYKDHDDYGITVTGNTSADVNAGGTLTATAPNQTNTGNLLGNTIALAGTHLTNGLTDPNLQTPASTVPSAEVTLGVPGVNGKTVPASVKFNPTGTSYFTTTSRLAMLVPGLDINSLLPENLRNTASPFLMDAWLEQQAIRQAALTETGRASFLAMNDPSAERAVLLQSGARFAQANGIHLGVALTAEQIAKLDSPILWYVTENFTGPDGKTYSALVPKVYLPDSSRMSLANVAGGTIQGGNVSLTGDTVHNTGFIVADGKLSIATQNLINEKRSADINNGGQAMRIYEGTKGYWKITGNTVQSGGFISAAELDLNAKSIHSVSGEFLENNQDVGTKLAAAMGTGFTAKEAKDDIHQDYKQLSKPNVLGQVVVLVVVVIVSIYTAGAASAALVTAAEESAGAAVIAAGGTATEALVAMDAAGMAVAGSWTTAAVSAGLAGMASSATSQLLTTGKIDAGQMFKSGLTSGLTAGLTNGLGLDKIDGLSSTANGSVANGAGSVNWGVKAMGWAARAGVSAGVSTAINGGSFKTAFVNDFVANGAASFANAIGDLKKDGTFNEVERVAAHAVLGCAAQAASGGQCAGGAIGAMASSIAGNFVDDPKTLFDKALIVGGLSGLGGLAAIAAGKDGVAGFNAAKNEVTNNRLLHPDERARAKQLYDLAKSQGLSYTLADIEDAMRWANYKGENAGSNTYVNAAKDATLTGPAGNAYASTAFDPMRPGVDTNSTVGYKTVGMEDGQMTLAQDMSGVTKPGADLATFIKSNASGYSWSPGNTVQTVDPNAGKAWTSNGNVPVNTGSSGIHYVSVMANGQSFNLPVADCPAGACTNGSPIAWTNPGDQDTLAAYKIAVDKEGGKTLATVAIGTGAVILAPTTLGGSLVAGGIVGGGTSAANQYIDDGKVDLVKTGIDTAKGATVGGLTFGVVKGAGALDGALDSLLPSSVKVVKDPVPVLVSGETKVVGSTNTAAANDASNGSNASTVAIPLGYKPINVDGLPVGSQGVVDISSGEIKVLTSAGTLTGVPPTSIPTGVNATVVPQSVTGIQWGSGIQSQGLPFEDYLAGRLPANSRLPANFPVIDFFDANTGVATSAKTLDTLTPTKVADPKQVYSSLKGNVDALANLDGTPSLSGTTVNTEYITTRDLQVAVPAGTTSAQWTQIQKAIDYANRQGVNLTITVTH